ncbi:MAG: amidohydrolase [Actinomycetia bacterium]|nr:amidohydrolase [Actinomycetes bacterium]
MAAHAVESPAIPWMLSADSHVVEPPELWDRVPAGLRDRAPIVVVEDDGDWIYFEGRKLLTFNAGSQPGARWAGNDTLKITGRWADIVPGAYDPEVHLVENAKDGIYGSIVFPTVGLLLYRLEDSTAISACTRAYNDWISEFQAAAPRRIRGAAMLNVDDVDEAVAELHRIRERGLGTALIPVFPRPPVSYADPKFDPLWAAAEALEVPLVMHTGTLQSKSTTPIPGREGSVAYDASFMDNAIYNTMKEYLPKCAVTALIYGGAFGRFPGLRVGVVEYECAWVPAFQVALDHVYTARWQGRQVHRYSDGMLPSDVFRRNVFVTFTEDPLGLRDRDLIGVDNLMFSTDYPHSESSFPRSREVVAEIMADVDGEDRRKILCGNAVRIFGLEQPPVTTTGGDAVDEEQR